MVKHSGTSSRNAIEREGQQAEYQIDKGLHDLDGLILKCFRLCVLLYGRACQKQKEGKRVSTIENDALANTKMGSDQSLISRVYRRLYAMGKYVNELMTPPLAEEDMDPFAALITMHWFTLPLIRIFEIISPQIYSWFSDQLSLVWTLLFFVGTLFVTDRIGLKIRREKRNPLHDDEAHLRGTQSVFRKALPEVKWTTLGSFVKSFRRKAD